MQRGYARAMRYLKPRIERGLPSATRDYSKWF